MPSEKKINNLVINEIESFDVYNYMKDNGLLNRSEVYTLYPEAIKNYVDLLKSTIISEDELNNLALMLI